MFIYIILFLIIVVLLRQLNKNYHILSGCRRIKTVDGTEFTGLYPAKTIFGNTFDLFNLNEETLFVLFCEGVKVTNHKSFFKYILGSPEYNCVTPEDAELVLNNTTTITKSFGYEFLQPFLGTGLLTSTHQKWHARRKLLTPSFHFNILQKFLETFKDESIKFVNNLRNEFIELVDLTDVIPTFTLNTVCETALGVNLDAVDKTHAYRRNISAVEKLFIKRILHPLKYFEKGYKMFKEYEVQQNVVKDLHSFSSNIINLRRKKFQKTKDVSSETKAATEDEQFYFKKERRAMLDTLLEAEDQFLIDHKGICEEVDTFMFEGFDTTSTGLTFILLSLAMHQEVQEKCFKEICQLPADFRSLTISDFNNLQYLECVIKESLRLFPPVPLIGRQCDTDITLGNHILPKGTNLNVHIYHVHRDPRHYTDPERFDPDRFLPENSVNRHPFSFIPFSAGLRNCIGQKFAVLEIKALVANLLKHYRILPETRTEDIVFISGLILRSKHPIKVRFVARE